MASLLVRLKININISQGVKRGLPFINKGIEFIDLHSIFKDNSVISSIPNYFNNSETPIICYKYNKPIRSTIFNFNKIVNDLDIDSNTPAS